MFDRENPQLEHNLAFEDSRALSSSRSSNNNSVMVAMDSRHQAADRRRSALSTREALIRLHEDIKQEIGTMEQEFAKRPTLSWLRESLSFESELSKMRWPSVLFMTAQSVVHFIVAYYLRTENIATGWVGYQGYMLTILLIFNLSVNLWDTKLRSKELLTKAKHLAGLVESCYKDRSLIRRWKQHSWKSANLKRLFAPKSPCVQQTLTYRDESCLNLPDYLLVRGDIIRLYPGERAPADCISLQSAEVVDFKDHHLRGTRSQSKHQISLAEGEIYQLPPERVADERTNEHHDDSRDTNTILHATFKKAVKGTDFLVLSTPYIKSLHISLQRSYKRPVNSIEKECFIVSRKYFETYVIPLVFLLSTIVTAVHYGYLDLTDSDQQIKTISIAYLLLRPSLTIMPFLPWMFPCFWMAVNAYGSARLLCCAESQRKKSDAAAAAATPPDSDSSPCWPPTGDIKINSPFKFENPLATPNAANSSDHTKRDEDELHDLRNNVTFSSIFRIFIDLILGRRGHVWRSSSLLQVLGCLTSLCCIDKVGILSWPNPTPEKVFVLTQDQSEHKRGHVQLHTSQPPAEMPVDDSSDASIGAGPNSLMPNMSQLSNELDQSTDNISDDPAAISLPTDQVGTKQTVQSRAEVLDVSQAFNAYRGAHEPLALRQATQLQFDDPNWRRYIENLKPLGLAILMNNCRERSFGDYYRFYKHISYQSILHCHLTPVVKRRCICALTDLIGFSRDVENNYSYVNQIGLYRLTDPSCPKKATNKLRPTLAETTTRLKLPFSNMVCNLHQDNTTNSYQVFSHGTADIVLDACVEYWNGDQLMPLDESTKRKISDFYHRTSLTSYCSAFSYTPSLTKHNLEDHYIELPSIESRFALPLRKLASEHQEKYLQSQVMNLANPMNLISEAKTNQTGCLQADYFGTNANSPSSSMDEAHFGSIRRTGEPMDRRRVTTRRRHLSVEDLDYGYNSIAYSPRSDLNDCSHLKAEYLEADIPPSKRAHKIDEILDELTDQVFIGMVASQYQACPDFVVLVEQLEHACIRFVHFSKENELRSRVFNEKMGLESGWNCHISLQTDQELDEAEKTQLLNLATPSKGVAKSENVDTFTPSARISGILMGGSQAKNSKPFGGNTRSRQLNDGFRSSSISSDERTLHSWNSLPSLVMQIIGKVSGLTKNHHHRRKNDTSQLQDTADFDRESDEDEPASETSGLNFTMRAAADQLEQSAEDQGFESLAYDMSNRAKLPKGIENIRPHLESVDNIPLQVSLFTDCTQELTKEMIEIMQDYGEIVCVIGSSSSRLNTAVFLQANASIAIEPLMPQSCCHDANDDHARSQSAGQQAPEASSGREKQPINVTAASPQKYKRPRARTNVGRLSSVNDADDEIELASRLEPRKARDRLGMKAAEWRQRDLISNTTTSIDSERRRHRHSTGSPSPVGSFSSSSSSTFSSSSSSSSASSSSSSSASSSSSSSSSSRSAQRTVESSCSSSSLEESDGDGEAERVGSELESSQLAEELPEPSCLASKLASLPCSYNYSRQNHVNLYSLIMEARHFTFKMKNTFVCMICFALSISATQFLASILFLPPIFTSGLTIWLTIIVVPLMSFTLMSTTMDSQVMKIAVGKNLQLKPENITFFVICYLIKFIPSVLVVVLNFGLIIAHSCKLTGFGSSSVGPCWMFTYVQHGNSTHTDASNADDEAGDLLWSAHLLTAQVCAAFLMVLYFVVISSGFVHRSHLMWQRSPTENGFWVLISLVSMFGQLVYNYLLLRINLSSSNIPYQFLASLPLHVWLISFICPIIVIGINLLVKRAEIKATIRQQRRARFDFNTKLGMNSPF